MSRRKGSGPRSGDSNITHPTLQGVDNSYIGTGFHQGGRPRVLDKPISANVRIDLDMAYAAMGMGNGNLSAGVREALTAVDQEILERARQIGGGCARTGLLKALNLADANGSSSRIRHRLVL